jgi:type I restriction enzyme S subunit
MGNQVNIPELRFPEFEGEWDENLFGNIASFSKGKGISKADIIEDGETECIRYGELYTTYNEVINDVRSKTNIPVADLILSDKNDVIIPASGETQIDIARASCVIRVGVALGGDLNIIKSKLDGVYLTYYLNNPKKKEIAALAQGNSVVHLYSSQLKTLSINYPQPKEQEKIATFLTAIDKRISLLTQRKEQLELYKKGMMQKIFSREIRFKDEDGNDFPEWKEKKLGEIVEIKKGEQLNKDELTEVGKYPCINGGILPSGYTDKFNNDENTIIMSEGGASCGFVNYIKTRFWSGGHCYTFKIKVESSTNKIYLYQLLKYNELRIMSLRVGSGLPNIQKKDLINFTLNLSQSIIEQTKIANLFSTIDKTIEKVGIEIDETLVYKKSLLQKIFV